MSEWAEPAVMGWEWDGYKPKKTFQITIKCEECGHTNHLARPVGHGEHVIIVCHDCEIQLHTKVPDANSVSAT